MLHTLSFFALPKPALATALAQATAFGLALLVLAACQPVRDTGAASATGAVRITVKTSAAGINLPAAIPSGIVTIVHQLAEDAPGLPELVRLHEGVTAEQLVATLQEDQLAALGMMTMLGGSDTTVDGQVTYDLAAGNYAGLLFRPEGPPLFTSFTAGAPSGAAEPAAAISAQLDDFAFVLPDTVTTGAQTWRIENIGGQWHELAVLKPQEGMSVDDLLAVLASEEQADPPPYEWVAAMSPMGAGQRAWVTWDLPPGEYTVICYLPDLVAGDMTTHAAHGMVHTLVVK